MVPVDLYCERTDPGLWAEPLNAVTNAAFILSAVLLWQRLIPSGKHDGRLRVLVGLLAAIGIGSGLFHVFATSETRMLDELPIVLFVLYYLWLYCRHVLRLNAVATVNVLAAVFAAAYAGKQFPQVLNGSLMYAPVLLLVVLLGMFHLLNNYRQRFDLAAAAGVFAAAIFFRTIDSAICPVFPLGTHFLWHILDATALYLATRALVANFSTTTGTRGAA